MKLRRAPGAGVGALAMLAALLLMAPSGGLPSRPQFRQVKIRSGDDASLLVLDHQGAAANNQKWMLGTAGAGDACLYLGPADDTGLASGASVAFCRSGLNPLRVTFTPGADGVVSDHSGNGRQAAFAARGGSPALGLWADDAAADNGEWDFKLDGFGDLCGRVLADDHLSSNCWLEVERSGTNIDSINLIGDQFLVNGAPISGPVTGEGGLDGSAMTVGQTFLLSKSADSTFNTDTCTIDPDLQIIDLPAGHYLIRVHAKVTGGADGARLCTGDAGTSLMLMTVCGGGGPAVGRATQFGGVLCAGANAWEVSGQGQTLKTFAGGTVAIYWRTNTTGGATATAESDSWLEVTRLL